MRSAAHDIDPAHTRIVYAFRALSTGGHEIFMASFVGSVNAHPITLDPDFNNNAITRFGGREIRFWLKWRF